MQSRFTYSTQHRVPLIVYVEVGSMTRKEGRSGQRICAITR